MKMRDTTTTSKSQVLQQWVQHNGLFKFLVADNVPYYASSKLKDWSVESSVELKFIVPYRHQSVGLVERYHQTLINRIRKMRFISRGSWTDYVDNAAQVINGSAHSITRFSPREIWNGSTDELRLARQRVEKEWDYQNQKRKVHSMKVYPEQSILVWNERPDLTRFQPKWLDRSF